MPPALYEIFEYRQILVGKQCFIRVAKALTWTGYGNTGLAALQEIDQA